MAVSHLVLRSGGYVEVVYVLCAQRDPSERSASLYLDGSYPTAGSECGCSDGSFEMLMVLLLLLLTLFCVLRDGGEQSREAQR